MNAALLDDVGGTCSTTRFDHHQLWKSSVNTLRTSSLASRSVSTWAITSLRYMVCGFGPLRLHGVWLGNYP